MAENKITGVNPELIRPLTADEQKKRGWAIEVNGKVVNDASEVRIFNEKMGVEVRYGMRSEGYDGVIIHEPGGGGSVIVPYAIADRELWIGLKKEERKTQGGEVFNLPRGYLDPGEDHFETAIREMHEETGVKVSKTRIKALGSPSNPNSANYDTSQEGEGVHFYAVEFIYPHEVYATSFSGDYRDTLLINKKVITAKQDDKIAERVLSCVFYPWHTAALVADQFSNAGVARLLYMLTHWDGDKRRTVMEISVR